MAAIHYTAEQALALYRETDEAESDWGEVSPSDIETSESDSDLDTDNDDDETIFNKENSGPPPKRRRVQKIDPCRDLTGRDGTVWTKDKVGRVSVDEAACVTSFKATAGPTEQTKSKITSVLQSFLCLIDTDMLLTIRDCTVQHARMTDPDWELSLDELMAFISLLFTKAVQSPVGAMVDCWSEDFLVPAIKETMPRDRFKSIMSHLCFDDKDTRRERLKNDRFAPISDIWGRFTHNCITSFTPGQHMTMDAQLFPTKVHCPFTQYMRSKPEKFGIKFWMTTDLKTKYVCNAIPYLGKDPTRPTDESVAEHVVMKVMDPFLDAGRNVTMDNFFTSLPLANRLLQRDTTLLGTMNKVRQELPPPAKDTTALKTLSTAVFRSGRVLLTVYAAKKERNVCILSSMHQKVEVGHDRKKKPNTVTDYNQLKCGVDILNQMAQAYSVRSATHRWPVAVFNNMLDLAAVNAYVLYKACTGSKDRRRLFLHRLAEELRADFMQEKIKKNERKAEQRQAAVVPRPPPPPGKTTQCQVLQNCSRNHSRYRCVKCQLYTCAKCREIENWVCERCKPTEDKDTLHKSLGIC